MPRKKKKLTEQDKLKIMNVIYQLTGKKDKAEDIINQLNNTKEKKHES